MFLKNRSIFSKIKRSKVTDYAALTDLKKRFPTIDIAYLKNEIDGSLNSENAGCYHNDQLLGYLLARTMMEASFL